MTAAATTITWPQQQRDNINVTTSTWQQQQQANINNNNNRDDSSDNKKIWDRPSGDIIVSFKSWNIIWVVLGMLDSAKYLKIQAVAIN